MIVVNWIFKKCIHVKVNSDRKAEEQISREASKLREKLRRDQQEEREINRQEEELREKVIPRNNFKNNRNLW